MLTVLEPCVKSVSTNQEKVDRDTTPSGLGFVGRHGERGLVPSFKEKDRSEKKKEGKK